MDANGARFFLLAGRRDLAPSEDPNRVDWDAEGKVLKLSSRRADLVLSEVDVLAAALRDRVRATDAYSALTRVETDAVAGKDQVVVSGPGLPDEVIFEWPVATEVTDVCIGEDGIISVVAGGKLHLRDSRTFGDDREGWRTLDLPALSGDPTLAFVPWRVAVRPGGGAFVLSVGGVLGQWTGTLLRARPVRDPAPGTFRPKPEDPETIVFRLIAPVMPEGAEPAALASSSEGRVACLSWTDGNAALAIVGKDDKVRTVRLADLRRPYSIAWLDTGRVAVLATDGAAPFPEALVFAVDNDDPVLAPAGERYPLRRHDRGPFVHTPDFTARYPSTDGSRPLVALSLPSRSIRGEASGRTVDSGIVDTCWHRLYAEAAVPEGCGIRVWLTASASATLAGTEPWYPHDIGTMPEPPGGPRAAWVPARSEIPGHEGMLGDRPLEPFRTGLWTVLVQRTGKAATRLVGRHLHVRVVMYGTGRVTPELYGLRVWSPRFSYVRQYLPELYHEDPRVEADDGPGPATPADFLERFVSIFEGVLTPIEDRVAESWQITNPRLAPEGTLDWLAGWIGRAFDPRLSEERRRQLLLAAPTLSKWRGTKRGLELALDVVTAGGLDRGDFVVLEEWRLRRTWATILGADLADEQDPLLQGLAVSGNSIVGDTLILGDEHHREFLAVFSNAALRDATDRAAVAEFFEKTAHRVTVLVATDVSATDRALITATIEDETPAHVTTTVRVGTRQLVVGVTALVGVDSRLVAEPAPQTVRLGLTTLGTGDRLKRPPGLHPDREGGAQ